MPTVTNKNKQNVNIKSESDPREIKQAAPTATDTNNKKSASIESHLEPIELKSNKIKDSKSDKKDMETVTTKKDTEAIPVEKSAGERLIPIEIPRVISWADLGVEPLNLEPLNLGVEPLHLEPLHLEPLNLGVEPLHLTKVKIGPLTETNQWSEKRAPDENSFQETKPQNKVVEVAEHFPGITGETAEKEKTRSKAEKLEASSKETSSKETSQTKRTKVEKQEHPVPVQMEELVEVVRIDKEKCEFTTPVMITKIGPVKAQMEELVEVVRIDTEKCEFTTPAMIIKIEKGETLSTGDLTDKSTDDDQELGKKNGKESGEPYILAKKRK
jgi:hypothetical protein